MDTTIESNKDNAPSYPPEFVAACERLNLRVAEDHYQLWKAGVVSGAEGR